ncbi:MAG: biosynthetic-type acetolactate synthase large subunit [Opitutales bacterium]
MSTLVSKENKPMKGADIIVKCLEKEGVDVMFAYPGGSSIDLHNALTRSEKIKVILPRHEQGCGFMAQGYARSTGKVGVCMATSGPGAMNMLTTIADAFLDSIPMVAITGQVFQHFIGKSAFQETDVFGMTLPVVKHSYLVLDEKDLPRVFKEAFFLAKSGRPGPVVIDIPKDVQQSMSVPNFDTEMDLPGLEETPKASDLELLKLLELIKNSECPVIAAGGGVINAQADKELNEFSKITNLPIATTLMGVGVADPKEDKNLYWMGMHGTYAGNTAVCNSDLLIAIGCRFSDRITGLISKFAPKAKIVHIDIDASEHDKNVKSILPIHSELKYALSRLIELTKEGYKAKDNSAWIEQIKAWKQEHPYPFTSRTREDCITVAQAVRTLDEVSKGDVILCTGVGQHQMWTPQNFIVNKPRQLISSLGAGTMGFGLPSAIGAKVACPERQVVDIDGDGSFQMNIQEMATAKIENIPVKVMLMNNQFLGMVMQWEDMLYGGVRGNTVLSKDRSNLAGPHNLDAIYPNYVGIAQGYGWQAKRIVKKEDLAEAIAEMLASPEPYLLEIITPADEHVLPFIPPGKSALEIIVDCQNCNKCDNPMK